MGSFQFIVILALSLLEMIIGGTTPEGLAYLKQNQEKEGVVTLPSGLQYRILVKGQGKTPTQSSLCECHYRGQDIEGNEFDSSYRRNSTSSFAPTDVIRGWTEALLLMKEGDRWELVIPSELAYGDKKMGRYITPGSVLVFEIELVKVSEKGFFSFLGNGPPIWMFIALYTSYILFFKIAPVIKSNFFPDKPLPPSTTVEEAVKKSTCKVYLDIAIGEQPAKRVEITLFDSITPRTAENFRVLCTGESDKLAPDGKKLYFKNSCFHRIIPQFMAQGGDFTAFNGTGGCSIYGAKFNDEFEQGWVEHSEPFLLSMANSGPNTNGSQFFITFAPTSWLNRKHVVFGKVTKGSDVIEAMEKLGSPSGKPATKITVDDCGEFKSKST